MNPEMIIRDAKSAIGRAQNLIVEHPNDPNAAVLELNEAYGLLETFLASQFTYSRLNS